ncbi:hypothetical protein BGX34_005181 [Mortierella sp. NVP85]|nr:hypothetical protein BGX34_005181 [Mortierella sp. NVP85]
MDNASLLTPGQPDLIPTINQHLVSGITFLNEFRDFCKERANIERDYAHRIEVLVRKYHKRDKKSGLNPSGVPMSPIEADSDSSFGDGTTTSRAWTAILNDTEALAKDRQVFSELLISKVYDPLKTLASKKDEARKKKLLTERDKSVQERDKAKAKYDASCEEVETSKQKQERAFDEKNQEKLKKSYFQDILDMNNNKNSYVLALQVANTHRRKYYEQDLPELSNNMQALDESRIDGLKEIWTGYIGLESKLTTDAQTHLDAMLSAVYSIDASEEIVIDDNARVFLSNKLIKLRRKHAQTIVDISSRQKDIEGLQNLKEASTGNNTLGDPDEVRENILLNERDITLMQTTSALLEAEIDAIVQAIGDTGTQNQPHDFKAASFTIPTSCDYCQSTIWGIAKQGFTCRDCGYNCHSKCEMKVPPNCSNVKGGAKAHRNSTIAPSSTFNTISSLPPELTPAAVPISELSRRATTSTRTTTSVRESASTPVRESASNSSVNQVQAHIIYDYKATNPGELSVKAGDVVTVVEGDDGSGWVTCKLKGSAPGLVPASYMEIEQFSEASSEAAPVQKVRVLYDYDGQSDLELTIREDEIIVLTSTDCSEGWWEGTLRGKTAQFPANYVELI